MSKKNQPFTVISDHRYTSSNNTNISNSGTGVNNINNNSTGAFTSASSSNIVGNRSPIKTGQSLLNKRTHEQFSNQQKAQNQPGMSLNNMRDQSQNISFQNQSSSNFPIVKKEEKPIQKKNIAAEMFIQANQSTDNHLSGFMNTSQLYQSQYQTQSNMASQSMLGGGHGITSLNVNNSGIGNNNNSSFNGNEESKDQEKKMQILHKDYEQHSLAYTNEGYTYQSNQILKKISFQPHASKVSCKYPLFKMLRAVSKKFLFNELEIVFFAYILDENEWKYADDNIKKYANGLTDFLSITEVSDMREYKCLLLYLVLNAYAVKYYLNNFQDMEMFDAHLSRLLPDFSQLFGIWSKLYATKSLKINPKKLNNIFLKLSAKPQDSNKRSLEDYNALVDNIIQISPPYNNSGGSGAAGNNGNGSGLNGILNAGTGAYDLGLAQQGSPVTHQTAQSLLQQQFSSSSFGGGSNNVSNIKNSLFLTGLNNSTQHQNNFNNSTNSSIQYLQNLMLQPQKSNSGNNNNNNNLGNIDLYDIKMQRNNSNNSDPGFQIDLKHQISNFSFENEEEMIDKEAEKKAENWQNNEKLLQQQSSLFPFNILSSTNEASGANQTNSTIDFGYNQSRLQGQQQLQQNNIQNISNNSNTNNSNINNSSRMFQLSQQHQQRSQMLSNNNQSMEFQVNPALMSILSSNNINFEKQSSELLQQLAREQSSNNSTNQISPIVLQNRASQQQQQQQQQQQFEDVPNLEQPQLRQQFSNSVFLNLGEANTKSEYNN